jgi:hypothetical protein
LRDYFLIFSGLDKTKENERSYIEVFPLPAPLFNGNLKSVEKLNPEKNNNKAMINQILQWGKFMDIRSRPT